MDPIKQIWKEIRKLGFKNEGFTSLDKVVDRLCLTICSLLPEIISHITGRSLVLLVGQLPQKQIHAYRITIGHDQEAGFIGQRFHRSIGVSVFPDMVAGYTGTGPFFTPAVFGLVDPYETGFILEHQAHLSTVSTAIVDFRLQFPHFSFC